MIKFVEIKWTYRLEQPNQEQSGRSSSKLYLRILSHRRSSGNGQLYQVRAGLIYPSLEWIHPINFEVKVKHLKQFSIADKKI